MGFKEHRCKDEQCPCFECSVCQKKVANKNKIKHHQNTSECRLLLTPEQKARDLRGRLWVPPPSLSDGHDEDQCEGQEAGQGEAGGGAPESGEATEQPPAPSKLRHSP